MAVIGCSKGSEDASERQTPDTPARPSEEGAPSRTDGFRYLPTLRKTVPEAGSAALVLESERRTHGDLWVLVADVRVAFGGLGIDAYHFAPRPADGVLVPDGGPQRLTSYDGKTGDEARRADLRRRFAAPQTRTTGPAAGYAKLLEGAEDPARVVALLAERSRIVADLKVAPEERSRAFAELLALVKDGPFRRRETLRRVVETFRDATFAEVVPQSESRLGLSVRLADKALVVVFERLPGTPPTALVVARIESAAPGDTDGPDALD